MSRNFRTSRSANRGLSLIELLVAMAVAVTVMSGVVQVLLASKSNFVTQRELATLQENARYAVKYIQDEVRMARFNSCSSPLYSLNAVVGGSAHWATDGVGIQGFDHTQSASAFPDAAVLPKTDALVVRRGAKDRYLLVNQSASVTSSQYNLNREHDIDVGDIVIVASTNCDAVGYLQVSDAGDDFIVQNDTTIPTTSGVLPGNCRGVLMPTTAGNHNCVAPPAVTLAPFPPGSAVMKLVANTIYLRATADGIPALYRERLGVVGDDMATWSEELVQGVENMQITYGLDNALSDGIADIYMAANDAAMNWANVVSLRVALRMRSIYPVYNADEEYGEFMGVADTDGADRFMRQTVITTISLRN